MVNRGLFVGRFQPFHLGHLHALRKALESVDEIIIVIGSAEKSHEAKNPFTSGERVMMIRMALEEAGIAPSKYMIIPVPDAAMHTTWVAQVKAYAPPFDVVFSNEPLTRRLFKEEGHKVRPLPLHRRRVYWATEIRRRMLKGEDWETLLPKSVSDCIKEIGGLERVQELDQKDLPSTE